MTTGDESKAGLSVPAQEARYFESLAKGVFEIPFCVNCERWHFFPRTCCPHCDSEHLEWRRPSGDATIYSTTTVHKPNGERYAVCLVDLAEGPRMMSTIVQADPDRVRIGQVLRSTIEVRDDGPLLAFTIVGDQA